MKSEQQTLSEIYRRYYHQLTGYLCKKFSFSRMDSEDTAQTAFAKFAALPNANSIDNPGAFIYKIAQNVALDRKRRSTVRQRYIEEQGYINEEADEEYHEIDPERILLASRRLQVLSDTLSRMPEKRRNFLLMNRFDEVTNVEAAKRSGISEAAVRKHIAKALLECKQALDAESYE
ncbi:RNA polymerase sigma factor [Agarilytica rhodophyticola]|uniref:RNA polymerase sigma factor n=1 Tax=Agarilytica rhodophyticola TaxID=1737490 RepID=UPI000B34138A|nr:RNA polymerase sigma factor [Agarilytica rhodophyticola]